MIWILGACELLAFFTFCLMAKAVYTFMWGEIQRDYRDPVYPPRETNQLNYLPPISLRDCRREVEAGRMPWPPV